MGLTVALRRALGVASLTLLAASAACAAPDDGAAAMPSAGPTVRAGALTVSHAVAPAPIADAPMALYLAIANDGETADTLVAIAMDGGGAATLHETVGGAMRPVARVAVPAHGAVALRPGGLHAMVERGAGAAGATGATVAAPAVPGDTVRATLRFARAGDVRIALPVVAYEALERVLDAPAAAAHAGH